MADPQKPENTRQLAGLLLKNTITSKDEQTQQQLKDRWMMMPGEHRAKIRETILNILSAPSKAARDIACLVVAKIASVEIPEKQWPDLVKILIGLVDKAPNDEIRESVYKTLGYVCEEVPDQLAEFSSAILDVISRGMKQDQPNAQVKLAATNALYNCLEFAKDNMKNPEHRAIIMNMIYSAATSENNPVRVAAYQCLVQVAELYYEQLDAHILDIFRLTHQAISKDVTDVALRAIEFWSSVAETEAAIGEEIKDAEEVGRQAKKQLHNFVNKALEHLAPVLLTCLTKQAEDPGDDTWTEASAAATCISLIATCVKDNVVNHVLGFIQKNITDQNWHSKEAAILCFGSILDGPAKDKLQPLVAQAFPLILDHCKDPVVQVKDTAAWTVGRICDLLPQAIDDRILAKLMNTLVDGLKDEPKVAGNICWAIHNLAEAAPNSGETSPLSSYFDGLVGSLLTCADRPDADQSNLRTSAYEALNLLVQNAAPDCTQTVEKLVDTFLDRLRKTDVAVQSERERQAQLDLQGLLVGSISVIVQKLRPEMVEQKADTIMQLFLGILQTPSVVIHEEVLMGVGSVAQKLGRKFERFFPPFKPPILQALNETSAHEVCQVAVGVVGDVCRALHEKIEPHCDEIVRVLLQNLGKVELERGVKPHVISCLGDVAMAIGEHFQRYLPYVMMMLLQASQVTFDNDDYDNIDYLNQLRESILEAYTSIVQALQEGGKSKEFDQYVAPTIGLLELIVKDENRDAGVVSAACGAVGDIMSCCGSRIGDQFRVQSVSELVRIAQAQYHADPRVKTNVTWALKNLQKLPSTS